MTFIKEFFERMKNVQENIIELIESEEDIEESHENFKKIINDANIFEDSTKFKLVLRIISSITKNHHREENFFAKIQKIIVLMKDKIKQTFSNMEIFDIFKNQKKVILFLIKEEIIIIDEPITKIITNGKYKDRKYPEYFYKEIKPFIDQIMLKNLINEIPASNFEENRKIGENEDHLCQLIRDDLIEDFIIYVSSKYIPLEKRITNSIFETNPFLLKKEPSLIEYAAFFGSIQIFRYLFFNSVQIEPTLWNYAIHSENPELISFFENNDIQPELYYKCLEESIKCHHNEIANYILNKYIEDEIKSKENGRNNHSNEEKNNKESNDDNDNDDKKDEDNDKFDENIMAYSLHYHNYLFFPNNPEFKYIFFYACQYNYIDIVEHLLNTRKINLNNTVILK